MNRMSKEELQEEEINRYMRPGPRRPKTLMVEKDGKIHVYELWRPLFGDSRQIYRRRLVRVEDKKNV